MGDLFQGPEAAQSVKWCDGYGHLGFVVVICNQAYQPSECDLANRSYLGSSSDPFHGVLPPTFCLDVLEYSMLFG